MMAHLKSRATPGKFSGDVGTFTLLWYSVLSVFHHRANCCRVQTLWISKKKNSILNSNQTSEVSFFLPDGQMSIFFHSTMKPDNFQPRKTHKAERNSACSPRHLSSCRAEETCHVFFFPSSFPCKDSAVSIKCHRANEAEGE